jgi:cellulose synthase/poly-beta-1,6-N-acetylglucosamine synthase-like glycosyltransferase
MEQISIKNNDIDPRVSVLVATCERQVKLKQLIGSLANSSFKSYELIIIDQSDVPISRQELIQVSEQICALRYLHCPEKRNKSHALNIAIGLAHGSILAFTDDDCIVDKDWLQNIHQQYKSDGELVGLFGKINPCCPELNRGKFCPSIISRTKVYTTNTFCIHWQKLGFGANMAFRKKEIMSVNGFRECLGPGSIGRAAEDADLCLRLLSKGNKIMYQPSLMIEHDKWLTRHEWNQQRIDYIVGEFCCYFRYVFRSCEVRKMLTADIVELFDLARGQI